MKKLLAFCLALLCCLALVSCSKGGSDSASAKRKIGILAPAVTHGWVAAVAYFAEQRCKEYGNAVEYKLYTSSAAEEMTTQLDDLEAWGADAIVAFPQWTGMDVPLKRSIANGTKIVMFDISIDSEGAYLVSGDNESMGIGSAKYLVGKLGQDATIAILEAPSSGSVSALRLKGFMDTISKIAPNVNLLRYATRFTREDGLKDFADILVANSKIDGVFSMDDETSIGVLQALKEANRQDVKVITGGGGCQEYFKMMSQNKDIWIQSALYSPSMVTRAVEVAYDLACGKQSEKKIIIPTTIVDRENCIDFIDENSPY